MISNRDIQMSILNRIVARTNRSLFSDLSGLRTEYRKQTADKPKAASVARTYDTPPLVSTNMPRTETSRSNGATLPKRHLRNRTMYFHPADRIALLNLLSSFE